MNSINAEQLQELIIKNELIYVALYSVIDSYYEIKQFWRDAAEENMMRYRVKKYMNYVDVVNDDLERLLKYYKLRGCANYTEMCDRLTEIAHKRYVQRRDVLIIRDNDDGITCHMGKKDIIALTNSIITEYKIYKDSLYN